MRCILHIGTEKTATTLLQHWLYDNEERLSAQGIALTKSAISPNNRKLVSYFQTAIDEFLMGQNVFTEPERASYFETFEDEMAAEIRTKSADHDTFIFTSEHFHSRLRAPSEIENLKTFLDRFFSDYTVLCYFREQSKVRTSLYSTALRGDATEPIEDFQNNVSPDDPYYNYLTFFEKWERTFGIEALRPRLFHTSELVGGDIRQDFLSAVLPEINAEALSFETTSANPSLHRDLARLFQTINANRDFAIGRFQDPTGILFKSVLSGLGFFDDETPVIDPRQADMYDAFHASNVAFFARYFGQSTNLFPRPKLHPPKNTSTTFDLNDLIRVIEALLSRKNLIVIKPDEIDQMRDIAIRLQAEGALSDQEAISLLKIASRARPKGKAILSKIEELHRKDDH